MHRGGKELLSTVSLLTNKPIIFAANMSESDFADGIENNPGYLAVKKIADAQHAAVLPICAEIEAEISGMDPEEKRCSSVTWASRNRASTASSTPATLCSA